MDSRQSRDLWHLLEPVNAVTYFCPESREAFAQLGCKGFWMGYFASRAAPMGPCGPGTVGATFFNFHPSKVKRAIPDAWSYTTPRALLEARSRAAAASLRRLLSSAAAEQIADKVQPALDAAIANARPEGKPLFGANLDVPRPQAPVEALWQAATTLREHRGDCHVNLLVSEGLDGLDALVLFALSEHLDPAFLMDRRGWSVEEWDAALERLTRRRLVAANGGLSPEGYRLRAAVEQRTDELSALPYEVLTAPGLQQLTADLRRAARVITCSGEIPFPNPIGLPGPDTQARRWVP